MTKRNNGEGSIRKRSDGRYEVRITGRDIGTGQPFRISKYANTMEEATKLLHTLSITMIQTPQYFKETITLGEWLDNWLETYMRAISPKTIINLNLYLHKALSQAVAEGLILTNPAASLNLPRGQRPQIQILTRDEQALLLRASYEHRYGVFIRLVLATGLRLGELLGLRWSDIEFSSQMLHVKQTLNRLSRYDCDDNDEQRTQMIFQTPKSQNSIRSIPILPAILQDLLVWKNVQYEDQRLAGDSYIFSDIIVTNPLGSYIERELSGIIMSKFCN